jgi:glycosyltransferase involved in cell wall biosynthesis
MRCCVHHSWLTVVKKNTSCTLGSTDRTLFFGHLRSFQQALAQPRTVYAGIPRLRYVYANEGASARYRVLHALEHSQSSSIHTTVTPLSVHSGLYQLHDIDLLVLHRLALGPRSILLLLLARRYGIRVAFDTDDVVWDERQREYEFLDLHYSARQIQGILRTTRRTLALMRRCNALILSTPFLAQLAQAATKKPVYVLQNAVSDAMQHYSAQAIRGTSLDGILRIGYFSGHARVHNEDFATAGAVLASILQHYPQVYITLVGEVAIPHELLAYSARIERRPVVDWQQLPAEIARVDIAIAPLVDNLQRRAKSAVKYLEAALVAVPLVAVAMEPYQTIMQHGRSGFLATSHNEWQQALSMLITNPVLRNSIGSAARQHVLAEHTTMARAPQFADMVRQIIG